MKIPRFFQIALLILLAAGAQPAYSAFWQWSKTASSNAGADPTINWAEGMSPSSVNDSARAMMARAAEYRDDISGLLATGGTSTAYTVTTNQGLSSTPNDGQLLTVTVNSTNGANATLAADGGTAYPIQSSPGVAVSSATLISGSPYTVKFSAANSAWMLHGFYASSTNIPIGGMIDYAGTVAPNSNFILPAGQCLSTSTYATYWVLVGSPASGACPGGQFAVIDLRGRVRASLDNLNGSAANRLTSSSTGCGTAMTSVGTVCANGGESVTLTLAQTPAHAHSVYLKDPGHSHTYTANINTSLSGPISLADRMPNQTFNTSTNTTGITIGSVNGVANDNSTASQGGGGAHPVVQPTIGITTLLRVL